MGICLKGKTKCERDRYNKMLSEKRRDYPMGNITYNFNSWSNSTPNSRETRCVSLGRDVEVLRLLKSGKIEDSIEVVKNAEELQARVEKDLQQQRTIIIAVGGIVLLLGTTLILRKL